MFRQLVYYFRISVSVGLPLMNHESPVHGSILACVSWCSQRLTPPPSWFPPPDRLSHQARISASVNAMRILNTGTEVEAAVADALVRTHLRGGGYGITW